MLLVAHDTKDARNLAMAGQDPGAGAVAGSAAWYDGARGVLTLVPDPTASDSRLLVAIKANYGRTGWGAQLTERYDEAGLFRGLELQARMGKAEVNQWREGVEEKAKREKAKRKSVKANPAKGTDRVDGWETGGASEAAAPVSTSAYFSMPWRRCRCLHGFPEAATCGNRPWRKSAISCGRNPRAPASRAGNLQSTIAPCTKLSTR